MISHILLQSSCLWGVEGETQVKRKTGALLGRASTLICNCTSLAIVLSLHFRSHLQLDWQQLNREWLLKPTNSVIFCDVWVQFLPLCLSACCCDLRRQVRYEGIWRLAAIFVGTSAFLVLCAQNYCFCHSWLHSVFAFYTRIYMPPREQVWGLQFKPRTA